MTILERLAGTTKLLVETAMGKHDADLVIRGGTLVNVDSRELLEDVDVAIKKGRIAFVGEAGHTIGSETVVIDARGKYVSPGFLDGHVHIESSMLTLTQFARAVLHHGTTGVFIDPHEIANVLGLDGVKLMVEEAKNLPLKTFVCVPSCVPAAPAFETSGAEITAADVEEALDWDGVVGLGEVMDYPSVLRGEDSIHRKIQATLDRGLVVEGHANSLLGRELAAYAAAGISSCHEATRVIDGVQRIRLGMYAMIREGTAWQDVAEVVRCITENGLDSRHACLVTDDRHSETLWKKGHMDDVVRVAINEGVDPLTAFQMATINTAEHFGLNRELGSIAPSKCADIIILDELEKVDVDIVVADGVVVARQGKLTVEIVSSRYPERVRNTVRLKKPIEPESLAIKASEEVKTVEAHVIGVVEGRSATKHLYQRLPVERGKVLCSIEEDIAKVVVVERHSRTGNVGLGFVKGFGLKQGAVASSIAHDSHNIVAVGVDDSEIARAINKLAEIGGGIVTSNEEKIDGLVELPVAGLMSEEPIENIVKKFEGLKEAWRKLGCHIESPFMTLSFLALPVLPELRITDKGLVDTRDFRFIDLLVD